MKTARQMRNNLQSLPTAFLALGGVFLVVLAVAAILSWAVPPSRPAANLADLNDIEHAPE
jgi:hypothetical protein